MLVFYSSYENAWSIFKKTPLYSYFIRAALHTFAAEGVVKKTLQPHINELVSVPIMRQLLVNVLAEPINANRSYTPRQVHLT
jgi:hypothetical protein